MPGYHESVKVRNVNPKWSKVTGHANLLSKRQAKLWGGARAVHGTAGFIRVGPKQLSQAEGKKQANLFVTDFTLVSK